MGRRVAGTDSRRLGSISAEGRGMNTGFLLFEGDGGYFGALEEVESCLVCVYRDVLSI